MGNYKSTYINKTPNSVDPSDWIMKQEQIGLQHQAIERQKKKDEEDRLNKTFDGDFDGEYDMSTSGNGTIDGALQQIAEQSLYELKEAKDAGEKALYAYGANSKQYREARQRYDNIMYRPKQLKLATTALNNTLTERQEQLNSGNYFQEPSDIDALNSFSKNPLKWKSMPNGSILINSGETTTDLKDFAGSLKLGGLIQRVDENATIQELAKSFKDKVVESRDGYTTNKYTNTWDDYTGEDGNKVQGAKSFFTRHYEDIVDDNYAKSVLAGRGEFGYDSMPKETQETLKANIINDMVEKSRPLISEKKETDFDTSARNKDVTTANDKRKEKDANGISFVDSTKYGKSDSATAHRYSFNTPYSIKGTNKSARPTTLHEIRYDEENGNVVLIGKEYVGKDTTGAMQEYENSVDQQNRAYEAWINEKDEAKSNKLYADYQAKVEESKVAKSKTAASQNPDDWKEVTITDKAYVTSVLSKTMGVESYKEIQERLKRNTEPSEDVAKENTTPVYKGLDDKGNPIFE